MTEVVAKKIIEVTRSGVIEVTRSGVIEVTRSGVKAHPISAPARLRSWASNCQSEASGDDWDLPPEKTLV